MHAGWSAGGGACDFSNDLGPGHSPWHAPRDSTGYQCVCMHTVHFTGSHQQWQKASGCRTTQCCRPGLLMPFALAERRQLQISKALQTAAVDTGCGAGGTCDCTQRVPNAVCNNSIVTKSSFMTMSESADEGARTSIMHPHQWSATAVNTSHMLSTQNPMVLANKIDIDRSRPSWERSVKRPLRTALAPAWRVGRYKCFDIVMDTLKMLLCSLHTIRGTSRPIMALEGHLGGSRGTIAPSDQSPWRSSGAALR